MKLTDFHVVVYLIKKLSKYLSLKKVEEQPTLYPQA